MTAKFAPKLVASATCAKLNRRLATLPIGGTIRQTANGYYLHGARVGRRVLDGHFLGKSAENARAELDRLANGGHSHA